MLDIYFSESYGRLYEKVEKGKLEVFEHDSKYGKIRHMFIKREIETNINGEKWYDIVTPYGYGGPIITKSKTNKNFLLIDDFYKDFKEYCRENNIVSEFIRFHPIFKNADSFSNIYEVTNLHSTVGTDIEKHADPFQKEFSKSARKNVRKALREGVSFKVTKNVEEIAEFKEIYFDTMDRNKASDYYYFDDEYFFQSAKTMSDNILLVKALYENKVIAMGFYFIFGDMIHIHLSGTLKGYLNLSPAYVLRYAVTKWAKENNYRLIHHGGGRTDDKNDTLYTFKKRFGSLRFDYKVGKKIWNTEVYEELSKDKESSDYFPLYRS